MLNTVIKCTLSKLKPLYMREAFDRLYSVGQGIVEQEQKTHGNNTSEQITRVRGTELGCVHAAGSGMYKEESKR